MGAKDLPCEQGGGAGLSCGELDSLLLQWVVLNSWFSGHCLCDFVSPPPPPPHPPRSPQLLKLRSSCRVHKSLCTGWLPTTLTPSLPQPVKFPGWKMQVRASKQSIFCSFNTSTFNAMCDVMKVLSHVSAKKETKRLKGFKFRTFTGRFQMTSWQWRG